MGSKKQLTTKQREERLKELVKDAEQLGYDKNLIKDYKNQLSEVQAELEEDKKNSKLYNNERRTS